MTQVPPLPGTPTAAGLPISPSFAQQQQYNWGELMEGLEALGSFEPLPSGSYDCQVSGAEATKSSSGRLMFKITFNVLTGTHANRKLFDQIVLAKDNPKALTFFFMKMAAMGLDRNFFLQNPSPEQIAHALAGRRVQLGIGQRVYNGMTKNEVKVYRQDYSDTNLGANPPPSFAPAPAPTSPAAPAPTPPAPQFPQPTVQQTPELEQPAPPPVSPPPAPVIPF